MFTYATHYEEACESDCIAPRILKLGARWRIVSRAGSFTPGTIAPEICRVIPRAVLEA